MMVCLMQVSCTHRTTAVKDNQIIYCTLAKIWGHFHHEKYRANIIINPFKL